MIAFLQSDLTTELQRRDPTLADLDSTKFDNKRNTAEKVALAGYQSNLVQNGDGWAKKTTLAAYLTTGSSPDIVTTVADVYKIALPADAIEVAGNTIWLEIETTGTFLPIPRVEIDAIVPSTTTIAFHEVKGFIILEAKIGQFTPPARVHCEYWRGLVPTASGSDPIDIKPQDFGTFCDAVASLIRTL